MVLHDHMRRHNEALRCVYMQLCLNHGLQSSKKIRNHLLQAYVPNKRAEIRAIRVYQRVAKQIQQIRYIPFRWGEKIILIFYNLRFV